MGYTHPNDSSLVQDCYTYLEDVGVTQVNLYVFLLALGGIYNVDLNSDDNGSVLVIDESEGRKIHSYFDRLFRNRLTKSTNKVKTSRI
jgi:hypothetical protein